jgi:hypothetical protein
VCAKEGGGVVEALTETAKQIASNRRDIEILGGILVRGRFHQIVHVGAEYAAGLPAEQNANMSCLPR